MFGPIDLPPQPPVEPPRSGEVEIPSEGIEENLLDNQDLLRDYPWIRNLVYTVNYGDEDEVNDLAREIEDRLYIQQKGLQTDTDENLEEPMEIYHDAEKELFRERDQFAQDREGDDLYFLKAEGIISSIVPGYDLYENLRLKNMMLRNEELYSELTQEERMKVISTINKLIYTFFYYDGTSFVRRDPRDFPNDTIFVDISSLDMDLNAIAYLSRDLRYYEFILEHFGLASLEGYERLKATFRSRAKRAVDPEFTPDDLEIDLEALVQHTW